MVFSATGGSPLPRIGVPGSVVISGHTTGEDELHRLTVGKRAVLDSTLGDTSRLISLEHFAAEQFQVRRVLSQSAPPAITFGR